MNRLQKRILTIAACLCNISLTAVVAGVATYAWFATPKVDATGISIKSKEAEQIDWEVLKFDDDLKSGVSYNNSREFFLQPYDEYIVQKNKYTNAILKCEINFQSFSSDSQLYIDIDCAANHAPIYAEGAPSYTSNICQFKSTVYSYKDADNTEHIINSSIDATSADTRYRTASDYFSSSKTPATRFVALHNGTPNKRSDKITLIPSLELETSSAKSVTMYIECSYNPALVSYYIKSNNLIGGTINLTGDITNFLFRTGAKYNGAYVKVSGSSDLTSNANYLIAYDGEAYGSDDLKAAFDGSGTSVGSYTTGTNYVDVYSHKARIANNEVTNKQSWDYTTADSKLTSKAGYVVGANGSSIGAARNGSYTNSLAYESNGRVSATSNSKKLEHNPAAGTTAYNYFDNGTSNVKNAEFYKYDPSAESEMYLTGIQLGGAYPTELETGSTFHFTPGTVTAIYNGGTSHETTENVTSSAVFTNYDMSTPGNYHVLVTYTDPDDGSVATANYDLTVYTPAPTISYLELDGFTTEFDVGATFDIGSGAKVYAHYSDGSKVDVTSSVSVDTSAVNMNAEGTYTVTVSYEGVNQQYTITVSEPVYETVYKRITSEAEFTNGEYLVVNIANSICFNPVVTTIDSQYNYFNVTITDDKIPVSDTVNAAALTWNGSSFKTTTDMYLKGAGNGSLSLTTTENAHTVTWSSGTPTLTCGTVSLKYNDAGYRFRYYSSSGLAVALFKKTNTAPLVSIAVSNEVTSYYTGGTFTRPTVTATYKDGSTKDVSSAATITGYNLANAGVQTVIVSYTEGEVTKTTSYDITVTQTIPVSLDNITNNKTQFYVGDTFALDKSSSATFSVRVNYNNGATATKTASQVSYDPVDMSTAGTKTVTIYYTEGGTIVSTTYSITVTAVTLTSIAVTTMPTVTTYTTGNTLNTAGIVITGTYNNGSTSNVTSGCTYSPTTLSTAGTQTITVTHTASGKTTTFNVTVKDPVTLTGIAASGYTSEYVVGETYSFDGTITATYSDSSTKDVTSSATFNPNTISTSTTGTTTVTVTYTEGGISKTTTFDITVVTAPTTTTASIVPTDFTTSYADGEFTSASGLALYKSQVMNQSSKIQIKAGTSYGIYNTSSLTKIKSITINTPAGTGTFKVYGGTSAKPSTEITGTNNVYDFSSYSFGYFFISNSGSYVNCASIDITYSRSGGTDPASVSVSPSTASVTAGGTTTLTATASGGSGGIVTWTSSDTSVATVSSSGVVTGVTAGTAVITADYEGATATCNVTVTAGTWSSTKTVTYTISSTTAVSASGTTLSGTSATYSQTYSTKGQMTKNNSVTLTLSGYGGAKIVSLTMSMKSNSSSGAGQFSMTSGSSTLSSISTSNFNSSSWAGKYSTSYVNVTPTVTTTVIGTGATIVIYIKATTSSLYVQSFTLGYQTYS